MEQSPYLSGLYYFAALTNHQAWWSKGLCMAKLICRHVNGRAITNYTMNCEVMKTMPDGRLKIKVYGERFWRDRKDKIKIRYVDADRVIE